MKAIRKTSVAVGILFIIATAAPLISAPFSEVSRAPDYLESMTVHQSDVIFGALMEFVMAISIAGIGIFAYSVLRKQQEGLALAYVSVRIIEGTFLLIGTLPMLGLLVVSQQFAAAGAPSASHFQTTGDLLLSLRDWASHGFATIAFSMSALMLNAILYRSRLVPRWLSGWGFVGAVISFVLNLVLFLNHGLGFSTVQIVLEIPLALNEMVLAVWLIAKGFSPDVKPRTDE